MHTCQGHVWAYIAYLKYSLSESNKKNGAEYTISYIYTLPSASWPPAGLHNVHFLLAPPSATQDHPCPPHRLPNLPGRYPCLASHLYLLLGHITPPWGQRQRRHMEPI